MNSSIHEHIVYNLSITITVGKSRTW